MLSFPSANSLVDYRPGDLVTTEKGQEMQKQVWREVLEALKAELPKVEGLVAG